MVISDTPSVVTFLIDTTALVVILTRHGLLNFYLSFFHNLLRVSGVCMPLGVCSTNSIDFVYLCIARNFPLLHSTEEDRVAGLCHIPGEVIGVITKGHKIIKHVVFNI